ncbi:SulP family inorganic anion transporter [Methyloligella sp. 2.7D]|uniref:SulP family inorganic anion transporter n=1 Tax=unclassified Methyloligella TaxID=2625955 RepID=UPI00157BEA90|nr:SulP family inorganic anion transporter [Methyloligella sp. GL2]QKP78531.1 SulP family inorganic anion transporter [Methyloligella sp. GL2]
MASPAQEPSFKALFTPKLITVLREGYGLSDFRADAIAGLTVAIVALPLSMAIAIASGVTPDRGLYTAIIGGFLISALGGSRFQIGGPAGAFIVVVATTVAVHGVEGLLLATMISGVFLMLAGFLRLGTFVKFIPYPVTVGFTAAIALIIFASQIKELLGLAMPNGEPGPLLPKLVALWDALPSISVSAVVLSLASIVVIMGLRRTRPGWPSMLIAVVGASLAAWGLGLDVETIGTRFGGIPASLPSPALPEISLAKAIAVLPAAASFALLGSIESLLSAVVADSMTGRRHRSNCELVAQGIANIAAPLFGGFCVTGTIARTATNIRSGARGPVSGMLHSGFLLLFLVVAAPLAAFIPLAALAGVLATVAWNMSERHAFATLLKASRGDAVVLLVTFLLTVFVDLTTGILVGFAAASLLFLHRMSQSVEVEAGLALEDKADRIEGEAREAYDPSEAGGREIAVCRISGAFFFGAAASVANALERIAAKPKAYVIDVSAVPFLDSTAAATIEGFLRKGLQRGTAIFISGANPAIRKMLHAQGLKPPEVHFRKDLPTAMTAARKAIDEAKAASAVAAAESADDAAF